MRELVLRNRQRLRRVNISLLRRIVRSLLDELSGVESCELCVHLVAESEMVRLNETFLRHAGSTDVITFDHGGPSKHGEIFVCVAEAIRQARRFRTTWQAELVRYVVHGLLHLCGFDDRQPALRCKMKREENRLLRLMAVRFPLSRLAGKITIRS
jgi:probable rRNA maturation factor